MRISIDRATPISGVLIAMFIAIWLIVGGCGSKDRANPLDPENPNAEADLFELKLTMKGEGVRLDWRALNHPEVAGYRVYRRGENEVFGLIGSVESGQLTYTDATAATRTDYYYAVAAYDGQGNESRKSQTEHIRTDTVSLFATPIVKHVGAGPTALVTSDLDNDGYVDIAVAVSADKQVAIMKYDGAGGFNTVGYDVNISPHSISIGDFNSDGSGDIVVADPAADSLCILWTTSGEVDSVTYFPFEAASSVSAGSLGGDARSDILVVAESGSGHYLIGDQGGFQVTDMGPRPGPSGKVILVDLGTVGGRPDIITVSPKVDPQGGTSHRVRVMFGRPDASHIVSQEWQLQWEPFAVAAADFDGANGLDFAVVTRGGYGQPLSAHGIHVFLNNGDDRFPDTPTRFWDTGWLGGTSNLPHLRSICAVYADNDYNVDLVVVGENAPTVSVWKGNGDGTFEQPTSWPTGSSPHSVFAGDFDNDQDTDLAVANYGSNTVSVLLNTTW